MNDADEPRRDEPSSSTSRPRRTPKPGELVTTATRLAGPVLMGLAWLVLSAQMGRAEPRLPPVEDAPVGLREAAPARSVQALPFVRPIDAMPVRSVQGLPFARPMEEAPAKLSEDQPTRRREAPLHRAAQPRPLRSIEDLPLRLSSNRPLSAARAAAGRSVVRATPLTTIPSTPYRRSRVPPGRAISRAPLRSARDGRYTSVQVSLERPVESEPIRSVQDTPIGPVREAPVGRSDDALLRPSWAPALGPIEGRLISTYGELLSEADPRRPLGSDPIELELELEPPMIEQPGVGGPPASTINYPPIGSLTTDIRPSEAGTMPPDDAAGAYRPMSEAPVSLGVGRGWDQRMYMWEATSLCHRPLYFEEVNLERYGFFCCDHRCGGIPAALVQPVLSGAHFFATVPALPYKMALDPPCECIYTLGHYRPGSCVPHRIHYLPLRPLPAAVEACVITGLVFALP